MNSIKWWLRNVVNLVAARYVVVDAVNHDKVLQFYQRNQFFQCSKPKKTNVRPVNLKKINRY